MTEADEREFSEEESEEEEFEKMLDAEVAEETEGSKEVVEVEEIVEEMDIEDIQGVGKITAEKLRSAGFISLRDIAYASAHELSDAVGSESRARSISRLAQRLLGGGRVFITAKELYENRRGVSFISTGSEALDELFEGGIETKAITEFVGEYGAGKTQLCHQLAVIVQLSPEKGGVNGKPLYIDTEGTFRPERIVQIAKYRGLDPDSVLENIIYSRAYNSDHQILLIDEGKKMIKKENIKLIVVDSLIKLFRSEYPGRENLASRQQKLNKHIGQMTRLCEIYDVAVVVTNQVLSRPDIFFGNPLKPAGGNIIAHGCTYRIWIKKSKEGKRIARIIDSPKHAEKESIFRIAGEGVVDA